MPWCVRERGGRRGASRPCPDKGAVLEGAREEPPAPGRPLPAARGLRCLLVHSLFTFVGGLKASHAARRGACLPCHGGHPPLWGRVSGSPSLALFPSGWWVALGGCPASASHGVGVSAVAGSRPCAGGSGWENGAVLLGFLPCSWGEVIPLPR